MIEEKLYMSPVPQNDEDKELDEEISEPEETKEDTEETKEDTEKDDWGDSEEE